MKGHPANPRPLTAAAARPTAAAAAGDLDCPVCLEIMEAPVTLMCGHSVNLHCAHSPMPPRGQAGFVLRRCRHGILLQSDSLFSRLFAPQCQP